MGHLCSLYLVFVMLLRLFIAALWSPFRKGPTSWLSCVMFNCVLPLSQCGILGQMWYLFVSISGLCQLSYWTMYANLLSSCQGNMFGPIIVCILAHYFSFLALIRAYWYTCVLNINSDYRL